MDNKLKSTSYVPGSAQSIEVRYQKALKQINKVVNVNTFLKQQCGRLQQQINELMEQLKEFNNENNKMMEQKLTIENQLRSLENQKMLYLKENEELKKQLLKLRGQNYVIVGDNRPLKKQSMQSCPELQRLSQDQRTIVELQKILNNKDETIRELSKKMKKFENNLSEYGIKSSTNDAVKNNQKNNPNGQLVKRLSVANEYIEKINAENINLRSKLIKVQGTQKLLSAKSLQTLGKYTPQLSPRTDFLDRQTRNSQQVLKRYHHLQSQNKKLNKKCESLKNEQKRLIEENSLLKKDNAKYGAQVTGYEALIEKQQKIITQLHSDHEKQINSMTEQFKQKLVEQRQNFSPQKSADHLKTIQSLQQQNKSLKRRLQLFQIQLQKYVKTLQAYKLKLSQCEGDVDQLMRERQQLIDRLTKLQNSNREKSRGSASRILATGNGSGGVDMDRRNSMGETGHFNYG